MPDPRANARATVSGHTQRHPSDGVASPTRERGQMSSITRRADIRPGRSARSIAGAALVVIAIAAAGCGDAGGASRASITDVQIVLDRDGSGPQRARAFRLSCPSGAHRRACHRLRRLGAWVFAPTPPRHACAMRYAGRQIGRIHGLVDGRLVDAHFSRRNGCEIRRYAQVAPILKLAAAGR
jgi:hypothetical protein